MQCRAAQQRRVRQRRKLDTNLLTLHLRRPGGESGRNQIAKAFDDIGHTLSMSTAWTIRALAFLIPLGLLLLGLVLLVRRLRRR